MADFVAVAHLDQLPPGRGMTVTVRGLAVALFNVAGTVYALEDACRHVAIVFDTDGGIVERD